VRVRPESDCSAATLCGDEMPPVEIEPMRVGIQLDGDALLGGLLDHSLDVESIRFARQEQTAGGMRENREKRLVERSKHALRHRWPVHPEARVNRSDHEIKPREQRLVVVETPIGEDVGFDSLEDAEARVTHLIVQGVNLAE